MTDAISTSVLQRAARRGEAFIAVCRVVFCGLVFSRALFVGNAEHRAFEWASLALGVFVSLRSLYRTGRGVLSAFDVDLSVSLDALLCATALSANALAPGPEYLGLFRMPDMGAMLLMAAAAGFRLSLRGAAVGGVATALLSLGLAALDHRLNGARAAYGWREVSMLEILVVTVTALAVAGAWRSRRLMLESADAAERAARAAQKLHAVLCDHHDMRTTFTSAQINVDMLLRALGGGGGVARELAERITEDLGALWEQVAAARDRSLQEVAELEGTRRARVGHVGEALSRDVGRRFPGVAVRWVDQGAVDALVVAGDAGLRRILQNLAVNACEGDGERRAARMTIQACPRAEQGRPRWVEVTIEDDGPGFPAAVLAGDEAAGSTKAEGSGLGLPLVRGMVHASGGALLLENPAGGGARAVVRLRAAEDLPKKEEKPQRA